MDTNLLDSPVIKKVYYFLDHDNMSIKLDRIKKYKHSIIILYSGLYTSPFKEIVNKLKRQNYFEVDVNSCKEEFAKYIIISNEVPSRYLKDEQAIIAQEIGSSHFNSIMNSTMKTVDEYNNNRKSRKPWTDEEINNIWDGDVNTIAEKLGRTKAAVNWQRYQHNKKKTPVIPKYNAYVASNSEVEEFIKMNNINETVTESKEVSTSVVNLNKDDIVPSSFTPFGESNDKPVLSLKFGEKVLEFSKMPKKINIFGIEIEF